MHRKQQVARDYVDADLTDALTQIKDATKLLTETGLPNSPKLTAELEAAQNAINVARRTFHALVREEGQ